MNDRYRKQFNLRDKLHMKKWTSKQGNLTCQILTSHLLLFNKNLSRSSRALRRNRFESRAIIESKEFSNRVSSSLLWFVFNFELFIGVIRFSLPECALSDKKNDSQTLSDWAGGYYKRCPLAAVLVPLRFPNCLEIQLAFYRWLLDVIFCWNQPHLWK